MRSVPTLLAISAAAVALTSCESATSGQPVSAPEVPSVTAPSLPPTTTTETTEPPADDAAGTTPTGTTFNIGQKATVLYETKSGSKETTRLEVTVKSLKKGKASDMENFDLDAQSRASDPFYVTITFRNAGPEPMEPGGIWGLINVENTTGDQMGRLSLYGDFPQCEGLPPEKLPVGKSFTDCNIYTAPHGQNAGEVIFGFYLESERTEISWKAG